ncbi:MAG: polyprenyl synthetase family protein [Gemmatimonadota bacterium]
MSASGIPEGFDLEGYLAQQRARVEEALLRSLAADRVRGVPEELLPVLRAGLLSGGKRLRPILAVAGWQALNPDGEPGAALYDLSASLEMIHSYSLMHDDLPCMDDAPLRRGKPTPHVTFGVAAATRAGAVLIPLAARQAWTAARALGLDPAHAGEVVRCLCVAAGAQGMVAGQVLDLEAEGRSLDEAELSHLHGRKTGALLAASLEMGAWAAGADAVERGALLDYGRALGLAFQIADDVLDRTQSAETLGKQPSDQALAKSTFVTLLGVAGARARAEQVVERARKSLTAAGIRSVPLDALAVYILRREH